MERLKVDYKKELLAMSMLSKPQYQQEEVLVKFLGWYDDPSNIFLSMEYFEKFHGMFQSFLLGYWYAALSTLINTSKMESTEAFGSWGRWDYEPLEMIRQTMENARVESLQTLGNDPKFWRHDLLKIAAYLFTGAPVELIRRIDNRTTGVIAKLSLLSASMLGLSTSREQASKFYLLDIDGSCIPSRQGIVIPGRTQLSSKKVAQDALIQTVDDKLDLQGCTEDFTAHIEPDWSHDRQTSLICFRSKGRIVQRLSPLDCDIQAVESDIVSENLPPVMTGSCVIDIKELEPSKAYMVPIDSFHGAEIVTHCSTLAPTRSNVPLLIPTRNLPRARTCLLTMYATVLEGHGTSPLKPYQPPATLGNPFVLYDEQARPILFA